MIHLIRILVAILVTTTVAKAQDGTTITIKINNIDNSDGQMLIGLYDSSEHWLKKIYKSGKAQIVDGKSSFTFTDVPHGTYAISVFHDENNDGKLDTNFFGIPSEDTGTSNDALARFGPPKWEDAKFTVDGGVKEQVINL